MIYIEKNKSNQFVLTLTETSRLSNPGFFFSFKNQYNLEAEPFYFTTEDISNYPCRYNQFELVESESGSTTGGTSVALSLVSGQYEYKVYEYQQGDGWDFSLSGTTGRVLEVGRMVVDGEVNSTISTGSTPTIKSVYK